MVFKKVLWIPSPLQPAVFAPAGTNNREKPKKETPVIFINTGTRYLRDL
jgi:hypothetical protein